MVKYGSPALYWERISDFTRVTFSSAVSRDLRGKGDSSAIVLVRLLEKERKKEKMCGYSHITYSQVFKRPLVYEIALILSRASLESVSILLTCRRDRS